VTGAVVIVSVVAHGASATPLSNWYARKVKRETLPEERESTAAGLLGAEPGEVPRISAEELAARLASGDPPLVLDVRSRSDYEREPDRRIPGDEHVSPDQIPEWAARRRDRPPIVTYCS
jgi:hypothetical protein